MYQSSYEKIVSVQATHLSMAEDLWHEGGMTDPVVIDEILSEYDDSGLTQREFAEQVNIPFSIFTSWL